MARRETGARRIERRQRQGYRYTRPGILATPWRLRLMQVTDRFDHRQRFDEAGRRRTMPAEQVSRRPAARHP